MMIPFFKMQGTGNDFIVINNLQLQLSKPQLSQLAKQICQRKTSVGADALMAVDQAQDGGDFRMIFFNADGTEAEMCGNGARCIARYAYENQLAKEEMVIETVAGKVYARRIDQRCYEVQLNEPTNAKFDLSFENFAGKINYVELGNPGIPHLVVHYENLANTDLATIKPLAEKLRHWSLLPKGANVNFYDFLDNQEVIVRTFERGVEDFTLACGTGSGSTAYLLKQLKQVSEPNVKINVLGGQLTIRVEENQLYLIGDTNIIAKGEIWDEDLAAIFSK
ncbi:MAG TPA: diaminopimelate epimerase [Enterococcus columbae]|nr:diaminopimelate epimerase [Enterococcus columbae]